jgi:hypothetical protein
MRARALQRRGSEGSCSTCRGEIERRAVGELGGTIERIRHRLCLECQELSGLALQ